LWTYWSLKEPGNHSTLLYGLTALNIAAQLGLSEETKLLLRCGAKPNDDVY
jgi:hypothetical protein